jgi:hypothetical protein
MILLFLGAAALAVGILVAYALAEDYARKSRGD